MKSKDIKKAIAKLLVAAVVMTTAAPAGDAWAVNAEPRTSTNKDSNGIHLLFRGDGLSEIYDRVLLYDSTDTLIEAGRDGGSGGSRYLPFWGGGGFRSDYGFKDIAGGSLNSSPITPKKDNYWFAADPERNGVPGYLYGYKITGWKEVDGAFSQPRTTFNATHVSNIKRTFEATVERDATILLAKEFRIGNALFDDSGTANNVDAFGSHLAATNEYIRHRLTPKAIEFEHTLADDTIAWKNYKYNDYTLAGEPVGGATPTGYRVYNPQTSFTHNPLQIPGFGLKKDASGKQVYTYQKYGTFNSSGADSSNGYGEFHTPLNDPEVPGTVTFNDEINQATVNTGNTPALLQYKYAKVNNLRSNLIVKNEVYKDTDLDGVRDSLTPIAGRTRTDVNENVEFGAPRTVKPNEEYRKIAPLGDVPKYVLDKKNPFTITFSEPTNPGGLYVGNAFVTTEDITTSDGKADVYDADRNHLSKNGGVAQYSNYKNENITSSIAAAVKTELDSAYPYFQEINAADDPATTVDDTKLMNLKFFMPNRDVIITYNWVKNPAYVSSVRVGYKDSTANTDLLEAIRKEYNSRLFVNDTYMFADDTLTEVGGVYQLNVASAANNVNILAPALKIIPLQFKYSTDATVRAAYDNALIREYGKVVDEVKPDGSTVKVALAEGIEYAVKFNSSGDVDATTHPGNKLEILAPVLRGYVKQPSMAQLTETNAQDLEDYMLLGNSWTEGSKTYLMDLKADPGKMYYNMEYRQDQDEWFEFVYEVGTGGRVFGPSGGDYERSASNPFNVEYNISTNPHVLLKENRDTTGTPETFTIAVEENAGKITTFYDAVPDMGYELEKWVWDVEAGTVPKYTDVPDDVSAANLRVKSHNVMNRGQATVRIKPIFKKTPALWGNYKFIADEKISYTGDAEKSILLITNTSQTSPTKTWGDIAGEMQLSAKTALVSGAGTIQWMDMTTNQVMQDTDVMIGGSTERVFKAIVEPTGAQTNPYTVAAQGQMSDQGVTSIVIDESPNPVSTNFRYIVTDDAGNILANIPGALIMANGGVIPSALVDGGLTPGYTYKVHSAPIAAQTPAPIPDIGGNISSVAPGVLSAPSDDIVIPTDKIKVSLGLDTDPAHVDKLQILVNPTTEGTDYQLIDPNGNVVATKTPTSLGVPVVFDNITQGGVYKVVPIRRATGGTPGTPLEINTDTAEISVPFKLLIHSSTEPSMVQINGVTQLPTASVNGNYVYGDVFEGSPITIAFHQWDLSMPYYQFRGADFSRPLAHEPIVTGSTYTFNMTKGDLIVTPRYNADGARLATGSNAVYFDTFDGHSDADATGFPGFVGEPLHSDSSNPYIYRVHLMKTLTDSNHVSLVQNLDHSKTFEGLFTVKARVEYKQESDTEWKPYEGEIKPFTMTLATNIIAAEMEKQYGLYEIADVAVPVAGVNDEDFHKPSYTNAFTVSGVKHDTEYVFGFFNTKKYPITIKSNRTNVTLSTNALDGTSYQDTLVGFADYQTQLAAEIAMPVIGNDGVTWNFKGLSKSETSFVPVDLNAAITASDVLYIYFENDRVQRADTEVALGSLIAQATPLTSEMRLPKTDRDALQNQINAALGVLNQIAPRKASTAELQAAIDALRSLYEALVRKLGQPILPPPSGGGGGGGGGSSSGGTIKKAATTKSSLTVGVDGNWQLIDANNHTWVFNMNGGNRVNGWNQLTYTYEGKTRTDWYFFNSEGIMMDGWFYDAQNANWYYLSEDHDGFFGRMTLGWYQDRLDGKWYYLDETSGIMRTGWNQLGGEWYYLNPTAPAQTYFYDEVQKKWLYSPNATTRPLGSMYANEATPDGYRVNASGAWVR